MPKFSLHLVPVVFDNESTWTRLNSEAIGKRVSELSLAFFVIFLDNFWVCSFCGLWYWLKATVAFNCWNLARKHILGYNAFGIFPLKKIDKRGILCIVLSKLLINFIL